MSALALASAAASADCKVAEKAGFSAFNASLMATWSVSTPVMAEMSLVISRSVGNLAENSVASLTLTAKLSATNAYSLGAPSWVFKKSMAVMAALPRPWVSTRLESAFLASR